MVAQKINRQNEQLRKVPSLEVFEVVLVKCNRVDIQYQQKRDLLCTCTPHKSYTYLLNVEPSSLVFFKTYSTEIGEVIITFTDKNGKLLEIEDKVNLILLINK